LFRQPSGSDEGAGAITLRSSQKAAQDGLDPIASGLPQMVVRGRPFLSESPDNIRSRYYKDGWSGSDTHHTAVLLHCWRWSRRKAMGFASAQPMLGHHE
jgi:hypothetical protein